MILIESIKETHKLLLFLLAKNKGKINQSIQEKIRWHTSNIKNAINERINELSDIADSKAEWLKKKNDAVPRLQKERSQLVAMLEFWSGKGY